MTRKSSSRTPTPAPARVISVTSGKGGVGKTHTVINLGLALVKQGKRVLLLDADLGLANINVMLGFQPSATIQQVLNEEAKLNDIVVSHALGFDIIPASSGIPEMTRLSNEERRVLIDAVDSLGRDYDYLLVDTGAGIGENVIYFNVAAEETIVVLDEEPTSLTDAYAIIKVLANKHGVREFSILANQTPIGKDGRGTYAKLIATTEKFLDVRLKFLGSISHDESVSEAVIAQKPYLQLYPSTRASRDIVRLAKKIISDEGKRSPRGGMQFFFQALLDHEKTLVS